MNRTNPPRFEQEARVTNRHRAHPEDTTFELYALGGLQEPQLAEFEEHLLLCATCQDRLDEATEYVQLMREAVVSVPATPPVESAWRKWVPLYWLPQPVPALAGAMALLFAVFLWQPARKTGPSEWRTVELETRRGETAPAGAAAGFSLSLRLDASGLNVAGTTAQIVSADGATVAELPVQAENGKAVVQYAPGLRAGTYWVRLKKSGETLREYALVAGAP